MVKRPSVFRFSVLPLPSKSLTLYDRATTDARKRVMYRIYRIVVMAKDSNIGHGSRVQGFADYNKFMIGAQSVFDIEALNYFTFTS